MIWVAMPDQLVPWAVALKTVRSSKRALPVHSTNRNEQFKARSSDMTDQTSNRVLVLGRLPEVVSDIAGKRESPHRDHPSCTAFSVDAPLSVSGSMTTDHGLLKACIQRDLRCTTNRVIRIT